jgi:hypothetical protein
MVVHDCNPSNRKDEAGGSQVGLSGLHGDSLSQQNNINKQKNPLKTGHVYCDLNLFSTFLNIFSLLKRDH